ncbi:unnamed protein product [Chondrus crispus]|uniref:Uncharacterized protein n=1 Tax=Chondrus crispus TaxID=2769 RepID=R7QTI9_CHOCR|nr:unnamed protein product [Chondrus crispus]CDF40998.1 unnamed protein product [Chondrus crispus]|eukprot:XP_005711292.1 unnamed protein product [Chondrus crispus]
MPAARAGAWEADTPSRTSPSTSRAVARTSATSRPRQSSQRDPCRRRTSAYSDAARAFGQCLVKSFCSRLSIRRLHTRYQCPRASRSFLSLQGNSLLRGRRTVGPEARRVARSFLDSIRKQSISPQIAGGRRTSFVERSRPRWAQGPMLHTVTEKTGRAEG